MAKARYSRTVSCIRFIVSILLVSRVVEALKPEDLALNHYLGCFYANRTQTELQNLEVCRKITIERCVEICQLTNKSYASLQDGTDCRCVDDHGIQVHESFCIITCEGGSLEYCAAEKYGHFPVYVVYTVCPFGTYGRQCDKSCHCEREIPCNRNSGTCQSGCRGNYTGSTCDRLKSHSEQYIGCYKDMNTDRAMSIEHWYKSESGNSLQLCAHQCSSVNFAYSGAQFSNECFCGESYEKHGILNETDCDMPCPGNKEEICGGSGALSVYHSCPSGNFGHKCQKVCNCEGGRCFHHNGTCQMGGCKRGWTGKTCNLRNCSQNNGDCKPDEICVTVRPTSSTNLSVCRCPKAYKREDIGGNCTHECSEAPAILCGPYALSCSSSSSNDDGDYLCHCLNGDTVINAICPSVSANGSTFSFFLRLEYLASSAALVFVLMLIIIVCCICRCRRKKSKAGIDETVTVECPNTAEENSAVNMCIPEIQKTLAQEDYTSLNVFYENAEVYSDVRDVEQCVCIGGVDDDEYVNSNALIRIAN